MRSPTARSKKQLQAVQRDVQRTLRKLDACYPDTEKSEEILRSHRVRIRVILDQGRPRKQPVHARGYPEEPYPLNPVTRWDILLILIVFIGIGLGLWGLMALLRWTGW